MGSENPGMLSLEKNLGVRVYCWFLFEGFGVHVVFTTKPILNLGDFWFMVLFRDLNLGQGGIQFKLKPGEYFVSHRAHVILGSLDGMNWIPKVPNIQFVHPVNDDTITIGENESIARHWKVPYIEVESNVPKGAKTFWGDDVNHEYVWKSRVPVVVNSL
jgi:hypothetical protein